MMALASRLLAGLGALSMALASSSRRQAPEDGAPLECFQVAQPVLGPEGPTPSWGRETAVGNGQGECEVLLMEHSFGNSYDQPFVGNYTPPECEFTNVLLTLTVVSAGHQYDRLAVMYLGDTELWRTSTAEPTETGIVWTHRKDVTPFLSLWRQPQKLIFDLGNIIDETYTGAFNTTLSATFFTSGAEASAPADLIIPLSARRAGEDKASAWHIPETEAVAPVQGFPRNARRAVLSVSANGQQGEEFWWYNLPEADALAFNSTAGALGGLSPFREVQVLLDGALVGVQWPFPVMFTGAIAPSFHRPVVGIQTFDLREAEIDVSPWLPVLCDGGEHSFEVRVVGIDDSGGEIVVTDTVGSYWVVTGKLFVWLDEDAESVTTGAAPGVSGTGPQDLGIEYTERELLQAEGYNESLRYTLEARRNVSVANTITTQAGERNVSWTQTLSYTNHAEVTSYGLDQLADLVISSRDEAADGDDPYVAVYAYPLRVWSAVRMEAGTGDYSLNSTMQQALELAVGGRAVFPPGTAAFGDLAVGRVSTAKEGAAYLFRSADGTVGLASGHTNQTFTFEGTPAEGEAVRLYAREVAEQNDAVVSDTETTGEEGALDVASIPAAEAGGEVAERARGPPVGKGLEVKLARLDELRGEARMRMVFEL